MEPEEGMTIVFFHPLLHEGGQLAQDSRDKYILRTDIIFERDPETMPKISENEM